MRCLTCSSIVIVLIILTFSAEKVLATSHYETYTYEVTVAQWKCYTTYHTYCYNWWYWNYWHWNWWWYYDWYYGWYWNPWWGWGRWGWCNSYPQQTCYQTYTTETRTGQRCQSGWVGSLCDVPTCTPACTGGMVCVDLNVCNCASGSSSSNCQIVPCSPLENCYPGTCVSGKCKCPPGFNGTNCENFLHKPSITTCMVNLYAAGPSGDTQVAQAFCAAEGLTPSVTWINGPLLNKNAQNLGLTKAEFVWKSEYKYPTAMPERPAGATQFFVSNAPVHMGISSGSYTLVFPDSNNFALASLPCDYDFSVLPSTADCRASRVWNDLGANSQIGHNKTILVKLTAMLGGAKKGDPTYLLGTTYYGFSTQQFIGSPVTYQAAVRFDLRPPSHCLFTATRSTGDGRINCTVFPIYIEQDITTNPVIKPLFLGWTDDGSGISRFHIEVFYMQPNVNGDELEPNGQALQDSVADVSPILNNYQFTMRTSGVYSIVLTTYDYANNSVTVRKIVNYMNQPSYSVTSAPVFIMEANPAVNHTFINSMSNSLELNLVWTDRFQANPLYSSVLSKKVRPLPINQQTIDDAYGSQFGQRSINAVDNQTGISSYTVRYLVDKFYGGLTSVPSDTNVTASINGETAKLKFKEPLKDGDTVVVWLTAIGSTGNQTTYQLIVGVDT